MFAPVSAIVTVSVASKVTVPPPVWDRMAAASAVVSESALSVASIWVMSVPVSAASCVAARAAMSAPVSVSETAPPTMVYAPSAR